MKRKLLALMLCCMMLACSALTGCGEEPEQVTKTTSEGELTKVRLQLKWLPQAQFVGYYVADKKGYYKEEGIDLEIIAGGPDIASPTQVENGSADFAITSTNTLLTYQEQGYPLTLVAQMFQEGASVLVSFKDKGVEKPEDMKGKKVGAWLGGNEYNVLSLLETVGLDKDKDLTLVKQDFTMDAFLSKELDVASATIYNELNTVYESGVKKDDVNVIYLKDYECDMLEDGLIANTEWLKDNKEVAAGFLRATIKGWKDALDNPEEATDIVWAQMDQSTSTYEHQLAMTKEVAKLTCPSGEINKIGFMDDEKIQRTIDLSKKYGLIKEAIPLEKVYDKTILESAITGLK